MTQVNITEDAIDLDILSYLSLHGEGFFNEIQRAVNKSSRTISIHLKKLEEEGYITRTETGSERFSKVKYSLSKKGIATIKSIVEDFPDSFSQTGVIEEAHRKFLKKRVWLYRAGLKKVGEDFGFSEYDWFFLLVSVYEKSLKYDANAKIIEVEDKAILDVLGYLNQTFLNDRVLLERIYKIMNEEHRKYLSEDIDKAIDNLIDLIHNIREAEEKLGILVKEKEIAELKKEKGLI